MYSVCKKKRIRANHQHIWGNYKSLAMMAKSLQRAETTTLPVHCCCIALKSSLHYNMWMMVFQKAWQTVWVAVPALHFDPDELEKTQHYKNTSQYGKLEENQKSYKSSISSEHLPMAYVTLLILRSSSPSKMPGDVFEIWWKCTMGEEWNPVGCLCLTARKPL